MRRHYFVRLLFIAALLTACSSEAAETVATSEEPVLKEAPESQEVEFLFVQYAEGVTLEDGTLTLEGIGDDILYFSDRPHRIVGRETIEEFLEAWHKGEESFAEIPPNAVLVAKEENEFRDLTVVLKDPVLTDRTLVYQVQVLDGPKSGTGDFAALFIDTIGFVPPPGGKPNFLGRRAQRGPRTIHRR